MLLVRPGIGNSTVRLLGEPLRWLLVLVVAFDLISSPFHAHTHDLGTDHIGPEAVLSTSQMTASDGGLRGEGFAHSQVVLRAIELLVDEAPPQQVLPTFANIATLVLVLAALSQGWTRSRNARAPAHPHRFLRPDGRAPPFHA